MTMCCGKPLSLLLRLQSVFYNAYPNLKNCVCFVCHSTGKNASNHMHDTQTEGLVLCVCQLWTGLSDLKYHGFVTPEPGLQEYLKISFPTIAGTSVAQTLAHLKPDCNNLI